MYSEFKKQLPKISRESHKNLYFAYRFYVLRLITFLGMTILELYAENCTLFMLLEFKITN